METIRVELHLHEVSLLLSMVNDRINAAEGEGLPRDHPSSVCREALLHQLIVAKQALLDAAVQEGARHA